MPAGVNEDKWKKAKEIASTSDKCPEEGTEEYWAYIQGIYKRMGGKSMLKQASEIISSRLSKIAAPPDQPSAPNTPSETTTPESRPALEYYHANPIYDRSGSTNPQKARENIANKGLRVAQGEPQPYKYLDSVRAIYGRNTDEETRKAAVYGEEIGVPHNLYRDSALSFPVMRVDSPSGSKYFGSTLGPMWEVNNLTNTATHYPHISAWADNSQTWSNNLLHEGAHAVALAQEHKGKGTLADFIKKNVPGHLSVNEDPKVRDAVKGIIEQRTKLLQNAYNAIGNNAKRSDTLLQIDSRENPITYPEYNANEIAPPLAGLQQYLYTKTGKRIESPVEYDKFISDWDSKTPQEQYNMLLNMKREGFHEAYRLLQYREAIKEGIPEWANKETKQHLRTLRRKGYSPEKRLKAFDAANRLLIPSWVQNQNKREDFTKIANDSAGASYEEERLRRARASGANVRALLPHETRPIAGSATKFITERVPSRYQQAIKLGLVPTITRPRTKFGKLTDALLYYDRLREKRPPSDSWNKLGRQFDPNVLNILKTWISKGNIQANTSPRNSYGTPA